MLNNHTLTEGKQNGFTALLVMKDVSLCYERWGQNVLALDSVSFVLGVSDWIMLVGHNGSGKSTLLRVLAEQIRPDSGTVSWLGNATDVYGSHSVPFMVEQDPTVSTSPTLTIFENMYAADVTSREPKKTLRAKYAAMLSVLGLEKRMDTLVRYLSGGERQLLSLFIASLSPRPLLLLDEPLAALDPQKSELCLRIIAQLHAEGRAIIQISHDHKIARTWGTRTIRMQHGRIADDERRC